MVKKKSNTQIIREMMEFVHESLKCVEGVDKMSAEECEILRERFAAEFLRSEGILLGPGASKTSANADDEPPLDEGDKGVVDKTKE